MKEPELLHCTDFGLVEEYSYLNKTTVPAGTVVISNNIREPAWKFDIPAGLDVVKFATERHENVKDGIIIRHIKPEKSNEKEFHLSTESGSVGEFWTITYENMVLN